GDEVGTDRRDTSGVRLRGSRAAFGWDWTVARQGGHTLAGRHVDAWGVFALQRLALSESGWKPKLTLHLDLASGGGLRDGGGVRTFHPLYASSSYLGESQFLGLSNLMLISPGIMLSPSATTTLSFEY